MKFTIIMPAYNAQEYIDQAIASVIAQTYPNWQLIIINDGSTDNTKQKIADWENKDNRILGVEQANSGKPSIARNKAIQLAQGDYVCFLDADDYYSAERLALFKKYFEANNEVKLCFSDFSTVSESSQTLMPEYLSSKQFRTKATRYQAEQQQNMITYTKHLYRFMCLESTAIHTITIAIERQLLLSQQGFNENLTIGEDLDLWFRLVKGNALGYIDLPLSHYRINPNSITKHNEKLLLGTYRTHLLNLERSKSVLAAEELQSYQRKVSDMAEHLAYFYLTQGEAQKAREYYRKAISHQVSIRALWNWLKSYRKL